MGGLTDIALATQIRATGNGPFGLGVAVGDPTGLSLKYRLGDGQAVSAAVGWSRYGVHLIADYQWLEVVYLTKRVFTLSSQFGTGLRLIDERWDKDDRATFGVRIPAAVSIQFNAVPVELSVEPAAVIGLIPETRFDLDVTLYARYFF